MKQAPGLSRERSSQQQHDSSQGCGRPARLPIPKPESCEKTTRFSMPHLGERKEKLPGREGKAAALCKPQKTRPRSLTLCFGGPGSLQSGLFTGKLRLYRPGDSLRGFLQAVSAV